MPQGDLLAVILSGGTGARLYPLTKLRAKPAVPLGGKYRLVDIPIGNCLNIGTMRNYCEASIGLTQPQSAFSFYDPDHPMFSHPEILPATQWDQCTQLDRTLVAHGCRLTCVQISESVIGLRSIIGANTKMRRVIMLGANFYETETQITIDRGRRVPEIGVGQNCTLEAAVIDKDARIGDGVVVRNLPGRPDTATPHYVSRDSIVVIPKNTVIPPGTII